MYFVPLGSLCHKPSHRVKYISSRRRKKSIVKCGKKLEHELQVPGLASTAKQTFTWLETQYYRYTYCTVVEIVYGCRVDVCISNNRFQTPERLLYLFFLLESNKKLFIFGDSFGFINKWVRLPWFLDWDWVGKKNHLSLSTPELWIKFVDSSNCVFLLTLVSQVLVFGVYRDRKMRVSGKKEKRKSLRVSFGSWTLCSGDSGGRRLIAHLS